MPHFESTESAVNSQYPGSHRETCRKEDCRTASESGKSNGISACKVCVWECGVNGMASFPVINLFKKSHTTILLFDHTLYFLFFQTCSAL